jgi:hypothetical protein
MAGRSTPVAALIWAGGLMAWTAGCGTTVEVRPAAIPLAPTVTTVVGAPISIGWGGDPEIRRIQRRASDSLIAATGGHAVIAEELILGEDDEAIVGALRALGEDPARALTFQITVAMGGRLDNGVSPIPGFIVSKRLVVDYHARIEIRQAGHRDLIGSVETVASGSPNEPEVGPNGEKRAAMQAIDAALARAIAQFAPRLAPFGHPTEMVEVPSSDTRSLTRKLTTLGTLYPELPPDDMQALAQSRERFLILDPGALVTLGLARGDLLGVPGGTTEASRAALFRAVARGLRPALAVERAGQRYILASARESNR